MMEFMEWLKTGGFYLGAFIGGVTLLMNSFKLIKEIKDNISRPIRELTEKVDNIDKRLNDHISVFEVERAQQLRSKILEFSDAISVGTKHSKETYDDILAIVDEYEEYCDNHPDFKNNRCKLAVDNIKTVYKEKAHNNSFAI